jgi:hypothetical protein
MTVMADALLRAGITPDRMTLGTAPPGPQPSTMSSGEKLARCVLMFYAPGPWSSVQKEAWRLCAGNEEVTTRTLGNMARKVIAELHKDEPA